jgi:hypothetical protein
VSHVLGCRRKRPPKGDYTQLAGLKTYTIGPEDSKKVILFVYDIFGT